MACDRSQIVIAILDHLFDEILLGQTTCNLQSGLAIWPKHAHVRYLQRQINEEQVDNRDNGHRIRHEIYKLHLFLGVGKSTEN